MNVTVVGLGKIGVPLAVQFASKGAHVTGYDINDARVDAVNERRNPLTGEPGIDELLTDRLPDRSRRCASGTCQISATFRR